MKSETGTFKQLFLFYLRPSTYPPILLLFPVAVWLGYCLLASALRVLSGLEPLALRDTVWSFFSTSMIWLMIVAHAVQDRLELALGFGATRKQHAFACILIGLLTVGITALIGTLALGVILHISPLWSCQIFAWLWIIYLLGCFFGYGLRQKNILALCLSLPPLFAAWVFASIWDANLLRLEDGGAEYAVLIPSTKVFLLTGTAIAVPVGIALTIVAVILICRSSIKV
jgi:hypothetical protein